MIRSNVDSSDVLLKILQEGTEKVIEGAVRNYIEEAKKSLDESIPEIMSTISLQIWKNATLEKFGNEIRITVDLLGGKKE